MTAKPGRNDPCPCGSGRKYKHCHLEADRAAESGPERLRQLGRLDADVTQDVFDYASRRFGEAWEDRAFEPFLFPDERFQLLVPYAAYHVPAAGRTAVDWILEERGSRLSKDERECLRGEQEAWLSLWEVVESRPGQGLTLRDRLSGEVREVHERTASRTLRPGSVVLGRVVGIHGVFYLNGLYPRALSPLEAAEVERRARTHLRRKRDVPVERLRAEKFCRYLIRRFEEAVLDREEGAPELVNNDGDPLLLTTDHFEVAPDAAPDVAERLEDMKGVEITESEPGSLAYVFLGRNEILLGSAILTERSLRVETNSRERADRLRGRIERACGERIRHRAREHTDPLSSARDSAEHAPEPTSPEARELARAVKEQHYAEWLDIPVPALGGRTPREAAASADGRAQLEALLAEFEHHEQSLPPEERFDFGRLRRELRLGDG